MATEGRRRLIESAFPLKEASIDSVHEKNVRHGHISTLHIWPARRPLAASRAALVATLLPDPENDADRKRMHERLGGRLAESVKRKRLPSGRLEETKSEETVGGILHWGREADPDVAWFRERILAVHGGRAPKVLDPFAGGGAIPLEAMRLGCEATAVDINPVAWVLLRCTLEYPQRLAGQRRPLPEFVRRDREFMEIYLKAHGLKGATLRTQIERLCGGGSQPPELIPNDDLLEADLAWHVRAWGYWVLGRTRSVIDRYYPAADDRPTLAYLWARTVPCRQCRATVPLLKTRWLCRKDRKRVLLTMSPNADRSGVEFGVETDVPVKGGNTAQRREHDRRIGAGTMTRTGVTCPCCDAIMTMKDVEVEGRAGRLAATMTAVVIEGPDSNTGRRKAKGKDYRVAKPPESAAVNAASAELEAIYAGVPFGLPDEPTPRGGPGASRAFSVDGYGIDRWSKLFTPRQLASLGAFVKATRATPCAMREAGYPDEWCEIVPVYLALMLDRLANQCSNEARWNQGAEKIEGTFARFALPMLWDFVEVNPLSEASGGYPSAIDWVSQAAAHVSQATAKAPAPHVLLRSAQADGHGEFDVVVTDPPYYDAIPYSDLMDFFHLWLRRTLRGLSPELDAAFAGPLGPKWDAERGDGELIDDAARFDGDRARSKAAYEQGMQRAFAACHRALREDGRMVVVFAHKQPDAWETLVSGIIRSGFVVDASWPIQTERTARARSLSSAALSSSVWLVCRKRPDSAGRGWDNRVLAEMRERIATRLRQFWDAGIRGPDFVWAATGPALEAYSRHPVVMKANEPGQAMSVSEFLKHARRIVVDFVVGRVLPGTGEETAAALDEITTYYLLHRHDFGLAEARIGPCILYAVSCGLSDGALAGPLDVLARKGARRAAGDDEDEADDEEGTRGGSTVRLKTWKQRTRRGLGYEGPGGRPPPLIDQVHRLMQLWKAGDRAQVDRYIDDRELRHSAELPYVLQALIELSEKEERAILESLMNHLRGLGVRVPSTGDLYDA